MENMHSGEKPPLPVMNSNNDTILSTDLDRDARLANSEDPYIFQAEDVKDFKYPICVETKPSQLLEAEDDRKYKSETAQHSPMYEAKSENPRDDTVHHLKRSMTPKEKGQMRIPEIKMEPAGDFNMHIYQKNPPTLSSNGDRYETQEPTNASQPAASRTPPDGVHSEMADPGASSPHTEPEFPQNDVEAMPDENAGQPILNVETVVRNKLTSSSTATPYASPERQSEGLLYTLDIDIVPLVPTDSITDTIATDIGGPPSVTGSLDVDMSAADASEPSLSAGIHDRAQSKLAHNKRDFETAFEVDKDSQVILSSDSSATDDVVDRVQNGDAAEASTAASPRLIKRPRFVLDAVELSTAASILEGRKVLFKYEKEESEEKLKHLKNPEVKKKEGYILSADTVRARLQPIGLDLFPIPLEKSVVDFTSSRELISDHYGGNRRSTFPSVSKKNVQKHGLDDFMFPNLLYNPHAPEIPGAPGLWYTVKQSWPLELMNRWRRPEHRVITLLKTDIWQYQGQYALTPTSSLTKEEWAAQDQKLKDTWAENIHQKKWGRPTRARIALRARLGRAPTEAEVTAALSTKQKFNEVLPADINRALLSGEEVMAVWTMKCVRYDTDFQLGLIEKKKTWVPKPKGQAKGGTQKGKKIVKAAKTRKRRAVESDDGSSSADDSEEESSDEKAERKPKGKPKRPARVYTPRGTRSRPIVI